MTVTVTHHNNIALVQVDNPPVNALSQSVRQGLLDALNKTEADTNISAVVLHCAGRTFIAGADIKEFNQTPQEPHLPDVVKAIEHASKPWVAAIHGSALGGGLEIALGCHHRVANSLAKFGMPEINLGLIPGAGGTVRLPRLIDVSEAFDLISSGKPVGAHKAHAVGLINAVVQTELLSAAIHYAQSIKTTPTALINKAVLAPRSAEKFEQKIQQVAKKARGKVAPLHAIQAIKNTIELQPEDALKAERELFLELKTSDQSAALRHIFFAERAVGKLPQLKDTKPGSTERIGIIGGGTMGSGIAASCLLADCFVTIIEQNDESVKQAMQRVSEILQASLERNLIDTEQYKSINNRFNASTAYSALRNADIVIEAVFEEMDLKHNVFEQLDAVVSPQCVLASNTSYLNIDSIAQKTAIPERVIGLHFFSPAHMMKLLELVVTASATPQVLATGFAFAKRLKKIAVPSGVCDGFIGNRIMSAYRRECEYMIEDGALPQHVDTAMRDYGFAMGLFEVQDLAGLDISWAMRKHQAKTRPKDQRYVAIADSLCEAGRLGRKTGKGWYRYENGKALPDPEVENIIMSASKHAGIKRKDHSHEYIINRILGSMQSTANELLSEGIAQSQNDIDVVMVNGYGFPRHKGGPLYQTQTTVNGKKNN